MEAKTSPGFMRKTVNDLVMAEMFLLQATIESANVIGDGVSELRRQITADESLEDAHGDSITRTLQRIADDAMEPYSTRFKYFRDMISIDD